MQKVRNNKCDLIHMYRRTGFQLFGLPYIKKERIGILAPRDCGKTTILRIFSGKLFPNFGKLEKRWNLVSVIKQFKKNYKNLQYNYFSKLLEGKIKVGFKEHRIENLLRRFPNLNSGNFLLNYCPNESSLREIIKDLGLGKLISLPLKKLTLNELQLVAVAVTLVKEADIYLFDEVTTFLNIYQRVATARTIKKWICKKPALIVDQDIDFLRLLAEKIYLLNGVPEKYGRLSQKYDLKIGITHYLINCENKNNRKSDRNASVYQSPSIVKTSYSHIERRRKTLLLETKGLTLNKGEVVGIIGKANSGRTSFLNLLVKDTSLLREKNICYRVSYKLQYYSKLPNISGVDLLRTQISLRLKDHFFKKAILDPLNIKSFYKKNLRELNGGELQSLMVAMTLGKEVDIYLLDEPTLYLDSKQIIHIIRAIKSIIEYYRKSAIIVDNNGYFLRSVAEKFFLIQRIKRQKRKYIFEGPHKWEAIANILKEDCKNWQEGR